MVFCKVHDFHGAFLIYGIIYLHTLRVTGLVMRTCNCIDIWQAWSKCWFRGKMYLWNL